MGLLAFFRQNNKSTASVAKDRLQILVAHERAERDRPSYLPQLQKDLLEVIRRYVAVNDEAVEIHLEKEGNQEILELNVQLPGKQ